MSGRQTNRLLGYPDDARLLIINADDFGMCHAVNEAIIRSLTEGVVTSTSLMVPCAWAPHAMRFLQAHPGTCFGVHLTVLGDSHDYRWGPLSSRDKASSLVDEAGYFYLWELQSEFLARAKLNEVEAEFRAQVESVLAAHLAPTHLDWHSLADGGRPDIFEMTRRLAKEYGLAMRVHSRSVAAELVQAGLPVSDYDVLDSYRLDPLDKSAQYIRLVRELPPGLSEWAVHPSLGNDEAQAIEPHDWRRRKTDLDFLLSQEARHVLAEEGIVLLDYRPLQKLWLQ